MTTSRSRRNGLAAHLPWNFGLRFSMKAVRPSLKSALEKHASDIFFSLAWRLARYSANFGDEKPRTSSNKTAFGGGIQINRSGSR